MQKFYHILLSSILFLILILLGDLLQFLPLKKTVILLIGYCMGITIIALFVPYTKKKTIEFFDFVASFLILFSLYLCLQQSFTMQQWFFLAFAVFISTISFGCNRRFKNMIQTTQS